LCRRPTSGNLVGLIYNYQSSSSFYAGDYFEAVLSPTGRLELRKFIHAVRYVVARGTHTVPRNVWFDLQGSGGSDFNSRAGPPPTSRSG